MSVYIDIKKDLGNFKLDITFKSECKRIGILGASGCGKSMTLKSIAGIELPQKGRIVLDGKVLFDTGEKISLKPQLRGIGYMFQSYALFPTMTVEQNIAVGLSGKKSEKKRQVAQMMEHFQLNGLEKQLPSQLSGGQQQRVALARIFVCNPYAILLDEPFSALDVHLRDQMQREMMKLLEGYAGTVIMVSHNRDEVYRMSEELLILDSGRIAAQGNTKNIFSNPRNVIAARLTGCKNIVNVVCCENGALYADEWKLTLPLREKASKNIHAIAIRAHEFSMKKTPDNEHLCFPVYDAIITEDLFEYNVAFKASPEATCRIDWKISKYIWKHGVEALPDKLYLKEQDILLLE